MDHCTVSFPTMLCGYRAHLIKMYEVQFLCPGPKLQHSKGFRSSILTGATKSPGRQDRLSEFSVREFAGVFATVRGNDVSVPDQLILIDHQPLNTDRAAGVSLIGADADFSAEAV